MELKGKFKTLWDIETNCLNIINKEDISDAENEYLAKEMAKFTEVFPVIFPKENITRKMHCFSLVLPIFVRKYKMTHKMLKLEQQTESMHHKLNVLESQNVNIRNGGQRMLTCIMMLENQKKVDLSMFNTKK